MSTAHNARAAALLRTWLLHGPAQLSEGEHAGGIAGSFAADGSASYVYGEITGYYLHWLGGLDGEHALRAARAGDAIAWCERQFAQRLPPTRITLQPAPHDWRNDATFLFDLAMLAGGIAAAVDAGLVPVPHALLSKLGRELERFVVDGRLIAVRALQPGVALPDRWSTRMDRYALKSATRVRLATRIAVLSPALIAACEQECARRAPQAAAAPVEMLHPTLYYLEGVLACDARHWPGAAQLLQRVLALANDRAELPEAPDVPGVWRSDVIAQALRAGTHLSAHGVAGAPDPARLESLATALVARVRDDGSIPFRVDVQPPLANTWCAMFAEQALRWHAGAAAPDAERIV